MYFNAKEAERQYTSMESYNAMMVNLYWSGVKNIDIKFIETDFTKECKNSKKGFTGPSFIHHIVYNEFAQFPLYMETALTGFLYNIGFPCIFLKRDCDSECFNVVANNASLFGIRILYSVYLHGYNVHVICDNESDIARLLSNASDYLNDKIRENPIIKHLIDTNFSDIIVHKDKICDIANQKAVLPPITAGESTTIADIYGPDYSDIFLYGDGIYWDTDLMYALDYLSDHNIMTWKLIGVYNNGGDCKLKGRPIMKKMIVGCNEYKLIDDICTDPYFAKKFLPIITSAKKESPITF